MGTILVVEDSTAQRQMITEFLEGKDFQVTTARNGVEALERILDSSPDVVLLDVLLPKMNGYEVCRRIKKTPKTQDIPVIMCSAKTTEVDRYWGMKVGADAYIGKPFKQTELIDAIEQLTREN
ncbi:response regulator transcription factor [Argonema galeatum]|uniref:response regulator transcription factor n=1 Tax=Argonema galeatum TaxID=2942762 RepID=UPI0020115066|nr:response regulator [Argonema galeatum]MCL1468987.1 response regulator [Argonema galeatum A003/A1]